MKVLIDLDLLPLKMQEDIYLSLKRKFEVNALKGDALLGKEIDFFGEIDRRLYRLFRSAHITTVRELTQYSRDELQKFRGFGEGSIKRVEEFLRERGLSLRRE